VYYDNTKTSTWWGGFDSAQMDQLYGQNYWEKWASENSITKVNKYGASKITFNSASAPTSFDMVNLVKVANAESPYSYTYYFNSLAELQAAELVEEYTWEQSSGGGELKKKDSVQTFTR
jgi:hypothetical protein